MTAIPRPPLEDRYFDRMAQAADEKTALIPHLAPGTVADIGAGGGELTARIAADPRITGTWAIDNSLDALRRLARSTAFDTIHGGTERLAEIGPVDNVVFSSVLHEIYSYAPLRLPFGPEGSRRRALVRALQHAISALPPGGRLLIRDFVLPKDPEGPAWLVTPGDEADGMLYDYLERTPFPDLRVLDEVDEHVFAGTRRTVSEALLTLNWGPGSLPWESLVRYGLADLDGYAAIVLGLGDELELVDASSEVQPGYVEHLTGWSCLDAQGSAWFPDTKALWVFQKKG